MSSEDIKAINLLQLKILSTHEVLDSNFRALVQEVIDIATEGLEAADRATNAALARDVGCRWYVSSSDMEPWFIRRVGLKAYQYDMGRGWNEGHMWGARDADMLAKGYWIEVNAIVAAQRVGIDVGMLTKGVKPAAEVAAEANAAVSPKQPAEPKQLLPVRLWVTHRLPVSDGSSWPIRCSTGDAGLVDGSLPGWYEVKWKDGGFYVEQDAAQLKQVEEEF